MPLSKHQCAGLAIKNAFSLRISGGWRVCPFTLQPHTLLGAAITSLQVSDGLQVCCRCLVILLVWKQQVLTQVRALVNNLARPCAHVVLHKVFLHGVESPLLRDLLLKNDVDQKLSQLLLKKEFKNHVYIYIPIRMKSPLSFVKPSHLEKPSELRMISWKFKPQDLSFFGTSEELQRADHPSSFYNEILNKRTERMRSFLWLRKSMQQLQPRHLHASEALVSD